MLTFNSVQEAVVASAYKEIKWTFDILLDGSTSVDYHWSTQVFSYGQEVTFGGDSVTFDGDADTYMTSGSYTFKVLPGFSISLSRSKSEFSLQAPNKCSFTVTNSGNVLTASDFDGCKIIIKMIGSDGGSNEDTILSYAMMPETTPVDIDQTLSFKCIDYISKYLKKDWPTTPLIHDLFPLSGAKWGTPNDNVCVPVVFGTNAYILTRPIYTDSDRFYVLGTAGVNHAIYEVGSPRAWGGNVSKWSSGSYTFAQSTKTGSDSNNYHVFQPLIADGDVGVWTNGNYLHDMPTQCSCDETEHITCFSQLIKYILLDIGIPTDMIDYDSFDSAVTTFASWGLTLDSCGYWTKRNVKDVLAELLNQCHSSLSITDKIGIMPLVNTSRATLTDADILQQSMSRSSFTYSYTTVTENDSGYVGYAEDGEPIDELLKAIVPCKASYDNIASDTLLCPFITDSQNAQIAGSLYFQRRFGKRGSGSFKTGGKLLKLQPDDMITINDTRYGGNYDVLIDAITISYDLKITIQYNRYKFALDDWDDISPSSISPSTDSTTSPWATLSAGPDGTTTSGTAQNAIPGRVRIGETNPYIVLDPDSGILAYTSGGDLFFDCNISGAGVLKLGDQTDAYISMTGTAIEMYLDQTTKAIDITTAAIFVGDQSNEHIKLSSTGLQTYDNTTLLAQYAAGGISLYQGGTELVDITTSGAWFGDQSNEHVKLSSTGLEIKDGSTVLATFASTITLGRSSEPRVTIDSSNLKFLDGSDNEIITISSAGVPSITISDGGDITVEGGGDINLSGTYGDNAAINFSSANGDAIIYSTDQLGTNLVLRATDDTGASNTVATISMGGDDANGAGISFSVDTVSYSAESVTLNQDQSTGITSFFCSSGVYLGWSSLPWAGTYNDFNQLTVLTAAPASPANGMLAYADGSSWNPGSGAGLYCYEGGSWTKK